MNPNSATRKKSRRNSQSTLLKNVLNKTLESVDRRNFRAFGATASGLRVTQPQGSGFQNVVRGPLEVVK